MKLARGCWRLVASAVAGLMAALILTLGGGRLARAADRDAVSAILIFVAIPLWIFVSVISYKFLKPGPDDR
jgi:hypothetical protein